MLCGPHIERRSHGNGDAGNNDLERYQGHSQGDVRQSQGTGGPRGLWDPEDQPRTTRDARGIRTPHRGTHQAPRTKDVRYAAERRGHPGLCQHDGGPGEGAGAAADPREAAERHKREGNFWPSATRTKIPGREGWQVVPRRRPIARTHRRARTPREKTEWRPARRPPPREGPRRPTRGRQEGPAPRNGRKCWQWQEVRHISRNCPYIYHLV
jgi:hypothetical protein